MKITQALIDQAAIIANAKVGDTIEESFRGGKWYTPPSRVVLGDPEVHYRVKPQPRMVYCNLYKNGSTYFHPTAEEARQAAKNDRGQIGDSVKAFAVPFQQIGEGEKP